jgi:hypothetical protein
MPDRSDDHGAAEHPEVPEGSSDPHEPARRFDSEHPAAETDQYVEELVPQAEARLAQPAPQTVVQLPRARRHLAKVPIDACSRLDIAHRSGTPIIDPHDRWCRDASHDLAVGDVDRKVLNEQNALEEFR